MKGEPVLTLEEAWSRLGDAKGLAPLSLSARVEGAPALAVMTPGGLSGVPLDGHLEEPALIIHQAIARARPDAGAIVIARPRWASALALLPQPMPGLFDEQVRQLGRRVERLERVEEVRSGHCAFLWGDGVVCLGVTLERTVFNLELLDKCAHAYVLAAATGRPVSRVPWWVREIAFRRLRKDQRRAAQAWASGERPSGFSAY